MTVNHDPGRQVNFLSKIIPRYFIWLLQETQSPKILMFFSGQNRRFFCESPEAEPHLQLFRSFPYDFQDTPKPLFLRDEDGGVSGV